MTRDMFDDRQQLPKCIVNATVEARREADIPSDLSLTRNRATTTRSLTFEDADEAEQEEIRQLLNEHNVPKPLESWIGESMRSTRENMLTVLKEIEYAEPGELSNMRDLEDVSGIPKGTIGTWRSQRKDLPTTVEKRTAIGRSRGSVAVHSILTGSNSIDLCE